MAIQQNAPNLAIAAGAALTRFKLVKADGTLCAVSATRNHIGVTQEDQPTIGLPVTVRMPHAGTSKVYTNAAFAIGARVYYDAGGTVGTTSASNTAYGTALQASSGAGSIAEILPD